MAVNFFKEYADHPAFVRIAPFVAFMLFIAVEELLASLHVEINETLQIWLYLPRVAFAAALLLLFRQHYQEIVVRDLLRLKETVISVSIGIIVFLLWINMNWTAGVHDPPKGFDPNILQHSGAIWSVILLRCAGAVVVVPIMEELFWRSFLLRYLIDHNFLTVAIGRVTWFSLITTCLLFGLEHHYVFAGTMAGILFTLVYSWTKSVAHCILCHAVANFCLAVFVLKTAQWQFW